MLLRKLQHDAVLGIVRVLIFINQHITELGSISFADIRMFPEKTVGINQQIVKVHRIALTAPLAIAEVNITCKRDFGRLVGFPHLRARRISLRRYQMVFRIADAALYHSGLIHLVVKLKLLDDCLDQTFRVCRIVNGKTGSEADLFRLHPEYARKDGMERTHPQIAGSVDAHLTRNALLHFPCRLVCKSQGKNRPRLITVVQQISNLVSQYARLSRSGPGYHQHGSVVIKDSLALTFVQFVQITALCHTQFLKL